MSAWEGLSPPYSTIVADPPWKAVLGGATTRGKDGAWFVRQGARRKAFPYSTMTVEEIAALPVTDLVGFNAHLYLWTTNEFLESAYQVARSWGFRPVKPLVWCKAPHGFLGRPFVASAEFCLFCRRGRLDMIGEAGRQWWEWPRGAHSEKPSAFFDIVESVSPDPYVELFARAPRLGWDSWGYGYEGVA